jgi:hypothetical protein
MEWLNRCVGAQRAVRTIQVIVIRIKTCSIFILVFEKNMANCIRGQGRAPTPETPTPWGDRHACPPKPLSATLVA